MKKIGIFVFISLCFSLMGYDVLAKSYRPYEISGLVGYWQLDGDAKDKSGNKNNGKWAGKELYSNGVFGQCGNFDGSNYVAVPHSSSINVGKDAFTYGAWVSSKGHTANQHFLNKRDGGKGTFWDMYLSGTCENINAEIANASYNNPQIKMSLSEWHHIVFTRDSSGLSTIYVDGKSVNPKKITGDSSNTHSFVIGNLQSDITQGFKGLIDEVVIYDRALNPDEIKGLYEAGLTNIRKNK